MHSCLYSGGIGIMKTNILHIAPAFQESGGGIFEVVENLSNTQSLNNKYFIDIICHESFRHKKPTNRNILNLLPSKISQFSLMYKLILFLLNNTRKYNIIHIHGAWSPQFILVFPLIFFNKRKIIYQPHGLVSKETLKKSSNTKKIAWQIYQRFYFRFCKAIICNSKREKFDLINCFKLDAEKIYVIPNGVASEFFERKKTNLNPKNKLLYVSQFTPIKNLESLFLAIKMLKDYDNATIYLDLYGYGDQNYISELEKLRNDLNLEKSIIFRGRLDRDKRIEVYDSYNYFILPSKSESFGIAALEALSRGCKVFVSSNTPWNDFAHDNVIVFNPSSKEIYQALKKDFISNNEVDRNTIEVESALKKFDWKNISKELDKIYSI